MTGGKFRAYSSTLAKAGSMAANFHRSAAAHEKVLWGSAPLLPK